jgi:hypothetical protein
MPRDRNDGDNEDSLLAADFDLAFHAYFRVSLANEPR